MTNNLIGQKFGRLTILESAERPKNITKEKRLWYLCQCECGNKKIICGKLLRNGGTKSCGCFRLESKNTHKIPETCKKSSARLLMANAYSDGNLTFEQFYQLSQMPCHYCGLEANKSNRFNLFLHQKSSNFSKEHGEFNYNGLDRVDNNLSHDINNVVPCCRTCNQFKLNMNLNEFYEKINNLNINFIFNTNINNLNFKIKLNILFPFCITLKNERKINIINTKVDHIRSHAKKCNRNINLTRHQIASLITSPCAYCNFVPIPEQNILNGIDRIDSSKGYELDNCAPCCKYCNMGKNDLPLQEFLDWIHRVKSFQLNKTNSHV